MLGIFSLLLIFLAEYSQGGDCGIDGKNCLCGTTDPNKVKYYDEINHYHIRGRSKKVSKSVDGKCQIRLVLKSVVIFEML